MFHVVKIYCRLNLHKSYLKNIDRTRSDLKDGQHLKKTKKTLPYMEKLTKNHPKLVNQSKPPKSVGFT